ncbi:ThuA domain-containing protein [Isoptericola luteus]|uniref:ThuA domain-containing protein n=1 Tax=Isoptericola luteus TaxID=2879484 RepID=UPI001CE0F36F|nr:ThuA domain-containing protein [Isoptericola sp. NEAU-Y5]
MRRTRSTAARRFVPGAVAGATTLALGLTMGAAAAQAAVPGRLPASVPGALPGAGPVSQHPIEEHDAEPFDALVFSKTAAFRHDSIPAGVAAIEQLGADHGFAVTATEDASVFTDEGLAGYEVVVFLSTTGDVLDAAQQAAFERYVQGGGGYAGIHAASDTEYDWPWYGELVGAYFDSHPQNQDATVKVEDGVHGSTAHLPQRWERFDEWYNFRSDPRDTVHVLASLDETTYDAGGGAMGAEHPTAWCQVYDGGRSWYTGGGHTAESYTEPEFLDHLLGGIMTAAGAVDSDCSATQSASYEMVPLDEGTQNPMMLAVADDGTVFYVERDGRVRVVDPASQTTSTAMTLDVTLANEDGLTGIVLDPAFAENGWVYLYWSPADVGADGPHNRVSRFVYDAASGTIDPASEVAVLKVETQRDRCCHAGGDMQFDSAGNLVVVTGDNTDPFESGGYAPIDERAGREHFDSQRTAANSDDLRGKVLRIHPEPDGTYTIPDGNMFAPGTADTRPEIFAMGFRNPFRIAIDPATDNVLVADYGPDAGSADPARGPAGTVEWNVVSEPGFYGWPYCTGANNAYVDYDFATGRSGEPFDCAGGVVNDSPNNTGVTQLPPAIGAEVWYGYAGNPAFPEIGGGGAPMGGPVYSYDPDLASDRQWPEYWDGKALVGEWNQGRVYSFQLAGDVRDDLVDINRVLPGLLDPSAGFDRPMDMEFGPDGALYVVDWGSGFGGDNDSSGVYRVDYVEGDPAPIAKASADVTDGPAPLSVQFSSEGTRHPDGEPLELAWTFGDGSAPSAEANPSHTYAENGGYTAQLVATAPDGQTGVANVEVVVGNTAPEVEITFPDDGGTFDWGDQIAYEITVTDPDGEVECADVHMRTFLGHEAHGHPIEDLTGCSGVVQTARDEGHGIEARLFWILEAAYTDDGGEVGIPLTTTHQQILQPKLLQSEFFTDTGRLPGSTSSGDAGVQTEQTGDSAGGGMNVGFVEPDDWWAHDRLSLAGVEEVGLRAASGAGGGTVSLRWGAPDGPEIGQLEVPDTGDWQSYVDVSTPLTDAPEGTGTLYFVLLDGGINSNWTAFAGRGAAANSRPTVDSLDVGPLAGLAPLEVTASVAATDPEGHAITYAWDDGLGGGFVDGTDTFAVTYDEPGEYRLQVRATDELGAYTTQAVTVTVTAETTPPPVCLSGRSDGFDGTDLDPDRWTVLDRDQQLRVADGHLTVPATPADFYGTDNTTVPNLVLQDLPDGPFTATARLTIEADAQYQQAGLLIYDGPDDYAKMVLQGRSAPADPATRIFQFIREEGGAPNEVAESNTGALGAGYPSTVYVRFTSTDGTDLRASYSHDGATFTEMPQTKSLAGLTDPRIGLMALAGNGTTAPVTDAAFDWFQITPDDTATTTGPDDEFDGDALDACRWSVHREDPAGYRVADGALHIDTTPTDIYSGDNSDVPNIVLQPQPGAQPGDDWTVETRVDGSTFDRQYHQGGLIVYGDDDNYVKLDLVTDNAAGDPLTQRIELRSEVDAVVTNPQPQVGQLTGAVWHLRLTKAGDTFSAAYSADGEEWTPLGEPVTHAGLADARVGLFALGAGTSGANQGTASFDYFRVTSDDGEPLAVTGALDPAEPDGPDGSWLGPVSVSVEATGGPVGEAPVVEVDVDGAGWTAYTTPFEVTDPGRHTVAVRATAGGETVVGETLTFTIAAPARPVTPSVVVTQAACGWAPDGTHDVSGGAIVPADVEGVRYVVRPLTDEGAGPVVDDPADLEPGTYRVAARPAAGYMIEPGEGWRVNAAGIGVLEVTIDEPECPPDDAPAVLVTQPTCDDPTGEIGGVPLDVVRDYRVNHWVDGSKRGKVSDTSALAPGQYLVTASPAKRATLAITGDWRAAPGGKATLVVTITAATCD